MTIFSGKDGSLTFDGGVVARVRNWSMQGSLDMLETTDLADGARTYLPGLKSASGSFTVFYHDDDASLRSVLERCITNDQPQPATLALKWGTKQLAFSAYVNSAGMGCSTGEVMSAELSFTMTGDYVTITL